MTKTNKYEETIKMKHIVVVKEKENGKINEVPFENGTTALGFIVEIMKSENYEVVNVYDIKE